MFHYYIEEPVVPQKVVEKRWKETIEAKITNLKEYKKTIDKQIKEYQNDLEALT
jgi:flagellar capping protein FliD